MTHDEDDATDHGSHVAGIAATNRYVQKNGNMVDALETVKVAGNAPDAQVIVLKVFGKMGGACLSITANLISTRQKPRENGEIPRLISSIRKKPRIMPRRNGIPACIHK